MGEQHPPLCGAQVRETHHALVGGFAAVLHLRAQDRSTWPGPGRTFSESDNTLGQRDPAPRKPKPCKSTSGEGATKTRQCFPMHLGVGLAPDFGMDDATGL